MHEPPLPPGSTVGLVGLGYYTLTVADLCIEVGLRVAFAVDDREGADGDPNGAAFWMNARGIPVMTTAAFVERMRADPVALVAARVECPAECPPAEEPFGRASDWVRRVSDGGPLVHPAALLDRVPPADCPGRYAVLGFPGTGNILTQHLVDGACASRPSPMPAGCAMRAGLAEGFFHGTVARVRAALAPLPPARIDFIPHEFGTMLVTAEWSADRAGVAFAVPSRRHHALPRFSTHSRPTRPLLDYLAAASAPCVAVVRHPLETLLSHANKIARPSRVMFDDPRFLDHVAANFADWHAHLLANRDRVHVVRYEDLAARRLDVLRNLADWVGMSISDGEAGALYDRYLNRNLPCSVPTHFFRGGNDKWRAEYEPRDLRRVRARVPDELFTAFGYDVPTEADLSPVRPDGHPQPVHALHAALREAYPLHPVPGRYDMRVNGSDPEVVDALMAAFQDPNLIDFFDAGESHPQAVPVRRAASGPRPKSASGVTGSR